MTCSTSLPTREVKLQQFLDRLARIRSLQSQIRHLGAEAALTYISDVEGNWLETWDDEVSDSSDRPVCLPSATVLSMLSRSTDLEETIAFSEFVPFSLPAVRPDPEPTIASIATPFGDRLEDDPDLSRFPFPGTEEPAPERITIASVVPVGKAIVADAPISKFSLTMWDKMLL